MGESTQLRAPWVHAPGKASSTIADVFASATQVTGSKGLTRGTEPITTFSSSSSYGSIKPKSSTLTATASANRNDAHKDISSHNFSSVSLNQKYKKGQHRYIRRPTSKVKQMKHSGRRLHAGGYRLQSKDSLVDVTACLQAKRIEVMKLWEKNLSKSDPLLLSQIEKAHRLALEAREEVESLRRTIHDFQSKEEGLSETDCVHLEGMRANVLGKVKEFEEADNELQDILARKSVSKTSIISRTSKTSQTTHVDKTENTATTSHVAGTSASGTSHPLRKSHSSQSANVNKELMFLKEQTKEFYDNESISEKEEGRTGDGDYLPFNQKVTSASAVTSMENLSRLKAMYENTLNFTSSREATTLHNGGNRPASQSEGHHRTVRFTDNQQMPWPAGCDILPENTGSDDGLYYRDKIINLQRKLLDTEQEVEELKSEIERIESDANFRVRMLHNNVQDKFDSLKVIPEYLQMVDHKLTESVVKKEELELALQEKDDLIQEERKTNKVLRKQVEEFQEKNRVLENSRDMLSVKNTELESNNRHLRKELEVISKQIAEMATQIRTSQETHAQSPKSAHWENQKLKLHCSELKEQLAQAKSIIHSLKKSKAKLAQGLNDRIEELIEALEQSQYHKRQLCDQIRHLKKSYNELFPPELFHTPTYKRSSHCKKSKRKPEPVVQSKLAWKTGVGVHEFGLYNGNKDREHVVHKSQDKPSDQLNPQEAPEVVENETYSIH